MTQLALLDLRHNKIAGQIPPLFGRLTSLQQLWLQDNQLTGELSVDSSIFHQQDKTCHALFSCVGDSTCCGFYQWVLFLIFRGG